MGIYKGEVQIDDTDQSIQDRVFRLKRSRDDSEFIGNGEIWYRTDTNELKMKQNGISRILFNSDGTPGLGAYPVNFIDGLLISYISATQIQIGNGACRSLDNSFDINVSSPITVTITNAGVNGLDTGSEAADTWYFIWIIADSTGGNAVAGLLSLSSTNPTLPTGYDKKRRLGAVRNNSNSDFLNFTMIGDGREKKIEYNEERITTLRLLTNGSATSFTDIDCSSLIPSTAKIIYFNVIQNTQSWITQLRSNGNISASGQMNTEIDGRNQASLISTDQIIEYKNNNVNGKTHFEIIGFTDFL